MVFEPPPIQGSLLFGRDAIDQLGTQLADYRRLWLIAGRSQHEAADRVARQLGDRLAGRIDRVIQHVPWETVQEAVATTHGADGLIAIGGGSAIGLAKAVAVETGLPIVAVPTTYSGSEMTPIHGITRDGRKQTARSEAARPRLVVYDPLLTLSMPPMLTATSGMNAMAHAVEALYAERRTAETHRFAAEAARLLAEGLPVAVAEPANVAARERLLHGAMVAGWVLGEVGMAIHHRICHILGGTFGVDHGAAHSVILPQAAWYDAPVAPEAMAAIAKAIGTESAPAGLFDLATRIGAPTSLASLGFREGDLDRLALLASETTGWNPRPVDLAGMRELVDRAYRGVRPA